jgi:PqqD family protein of HPr-rel-A system
VATYSAPPLTDLHFAALDGLTAVYHRASGQTHVVIDPLPELLQLLAEQPRDENAILAAWGIDDPEALDRAGLSAHLDTLIACGLVVAR